MTIAQRISEWIPRRTDNQGLNIEILPYEQRADKATWPVGNDKIIYRIKDVFPLWQAHGGWDPKPNQKWTIPQWARDSYLKPMDHPNHCDPGGGDHHIIIGVLNADGSFSTRQDGILYWWYDALTSPVQSSPTDKFELKKLDLKGWSDMMMAGNGDSSYHSDEGAHGPYKVAHFGASDVIYGFGMPYNEHLSFVTLFQAEFQDTTTPEPPPIDPNGTGLVQKLQDLDNVLAPLNTAASNLHTAIQAMLAALVGTQ